MKQLLKWGFGLLFLLTAFGVLIKPPFMYVAFFTLLFAGIICLPPTLTFFEKFFKTPLQSTLKYLLVILLSSIGFYDIGKNAPEISASQNSKNVETKQNADIKSDSMESMTQSQKDSMQIALQKKAITDQIEERKDNTIPATNLVYAYTQNEVKADGIFKDKEFYVTGVIDDIKKDFTDNIYITLKSNDVIRQVQCYIDDNDFAANLNRGDKITLYGKCDGLMMNVQMKNCQSVKSIETLKKELKEYK